MDRLCQSDNMGSKRRPHTLQVTWHRILRYELRQLSALTGTNTWGHTEKEIIGTPCHLTTAPRNDNSACNVLVSYWASGSVPLRTPPETSQMMCITHIRKVTWLCSNEDNFWYTKVLTSRSRKLQPGCMLTRALSLEILKKQAFTKCWETPKHIFHATCSNRSLGMKLFRFANSAKVKRVSIQNIAQHPTEECFETLAAGMLTLWFK